MTMTNERNARAPSQEAQVLHAGKFLSLKKKGHWEFADRVGVTDAAVIIAVTAEGCLLLTEQFRIPVNAPVIELPAGLAGDVPGEEDEPIQATAKRELMEETGYAADQFEVLLTGPTSAGLASELVTLVLATGLTKVGSGGGHGDENIIVHEVPLEGAAAWLNERIKAGVLVDPKVFSALYFTSRNHPVHPPTAHTQEG